MNEFEPGDVVIDVIWDACWTGVVTGVHSDGDADVLWDGSSTATRMAPHQITHKPARIPLEAL